jgi:hypothetical protein
MLVILDVRLRQLEPEPMLRMQIDFVNEQIIECVHMIHLIIIFNWQ